MCIIFHLFYLRNSTTSSSRNTSAKSTYSPSPTDMKQSPQQRMQDMTKSLKPKDNSQGLPIYRSNSFHCSNKKANQHGCEDDCASGYDSSIAESYSRKHPHFYLDEDELLLPIQPSHTHLAQRSLYGSKSPQISPSKSRSKLEALDSLVISTIYNVSNKLCRAAANVLRKAENAFPDQDEEQVCSDLLFTNPDPALAVLALVGTGVHTESVSKAGNKCYPFSPQHSRLFFISWKMLIFPQLPQRKPQGNSQVRLSHILHPFYVCKYSPQSTREVFFVVLKLGLCLQD